MKRDVAHALLWTAVASYCAVHVVKRDVMAAASWLDVLVGLAVVGALVLIDRLYPKARPSQRRST